MINNKRSYYERKKRELWENKLRKQLVKEGYALDRAASKKAVDKVLSNLEKTTNKTMTISQMQNEISAKNLLITSTINESYKQSKKKINIKPTGGKSHIFINDTFKNIHQKIQNNKYAQLGIPIILAIRKYKLRYIKKYYKKKYDFVKLNTPIHKDTTISDLKNIIKNNQKNINNKKKQTQKTHTIKKINNKTEIIQNFVDNAKKLKVDNQLVQKMINNKV